VYGTGVVRLIARLWILRWHVLAWALVLASAFYSNLTNSVGGPVR